MLDSDLAELYRASTKRLNEQVKRNRLDIFLVNGWRLEGFPKGEEPHCHLFKNNRDGTSDVTIQAGLARSGARSLLLTALGGERHYSAEAQRQGPAHLPECALNLRYCAHAWILADVRTCVNAGV